MAQAQAKPTSAAFDLTGLLRRAADHHRRGELSEAEALYRQVLAHRPDDFNALHLTGVLMQQRGRSSEALALIGAALAANADAAPAHCNYGLVLAALGRHDEALAAYDRALALKTDYAEAHNNRGNALRSLGRLEEALDSLKRAIALRPDYADALINRARLLRRLERPQEALAAYHAALARNPGNAELLLERGNLHYAARRFTEALADYDKTISLRPDFAEAHNNRGNTLGELGLRQEALDAFGRALALKADYAEAYNNRGNVQLELNRPEQALADYDSALVLKADDAGTLTNRGSALRHLNRFDEARASLNRAIALNPELAEAYWNRSLVCLACGDFAQGWRDYEWRWRRNTAEMVPRDFAAPQWRGEDLTGKTILLHAEQGFGDSIQFIRYLPLVLVRGGRVVLEIPDALRPLIAADNIATVSRGAPLPPVDYHCPLMSLPLAFATTPASVPAQVPYLHAPVARLEKWRARLPPSEAPRVGLTWSGKPSHKNDHNRSIPLAQLAPLLALPGVQFVSLQKEVRDADRAALTQFPALLRLDAALGDFADTAAAVACLDLVIAVDSAVAHLTGAMGKPLWLMLPAIGDWRWMTARADSPWYPSARLFRQPMGDDWTGTIAHLARELALFMKNRPATA
jgi:tetratricopeptide (TPR) repeat protein